MARNQVVVSCTEGTWTQLTNADVSAITFQVQSDGVVRIRCTTDTTTPASTDGGRFYAYREGEANIDPADLALGTGGTPVRVWSFAVGRDVDVYVDHA